MRTLPGLALVVAAIGAGPVSGQTGGATTSLSVNPVALGHIVELRITVAVPAGSIVYFPGTLPSSASFESNGAMSWTAEPAPKGATLKLRYPLLAFGIGRVRAPAVNILMRPAVRGAGGGTGGGRALPGGSVIGAWDEAPPPGPATILASVAPLEVRVASLSELDAVLGGVGPMPAADVVGPSLGRGPLALLVASAAIIIGLLVAALIRLWSWTRGGRGRAKGAASLDSGRRIALRELDALLALDLHGEGRIHEFYTRTSGIIRRYVEQFDPRWGPNLTSTELMHGLENLAVGAPATALSSEMSGAEVVKFGQHWSDAGIAEGHWRAVRDWVQMSGRQAS